MFYSNVRAYNRLDVARSASYTSLFQCFVNYRQGLRETTHGDGFTLHAVEIGISKVPYDVSLDMVDYADGECVQTLVVRKDLYSQLEAQRLAKSYERLAKAFIEDPTLSLDQPDIFEPAEIEEVIKFSRGKYHTDFCSDMAFSMISDLSATGLSWPSQWPETVIHRIDQIATTRPHDVAVRHGNMTSTYGEISAHANAIAAALQAAHVVPGSRVAVLQEPHPAWISSLLGIMRVGAVYFPLDLGLPWARLAAMVQDCQPPVVLVDENGEKHVEKLERPGMQAINVASVGQQNESTQISATTDGPAVILYTSGSSGTPKGILLKHQGLRNWAEPIADIYNLRSEVVLQQTSPTFDMSLTQILSALCFGGSLLLLSRQQRGDAKAISKIMASQGVTFTCATPSEYTTWIQYGRQELRGSIAWKTAFCGGEPVPVALIGQLASLGKTDLRFYNQYGPTETSICSTMIQVPLEILRGPIAAGSPLPNYSIYVVDDNVRLVPPGVQGEIYIGGAGVGHGYLNNPELTAARFIQNVFATLEDKARGWTTLHRTGDLGRWREDGSLLIEGRILGDTQVKLRGLRVDLAEIEHTIMDVAGGVLRGAVASVYSSSLEKPEFLVAHVVFNDEVSRLDSDKEQQISAIQSQLRRNLPQYMCPAAIVSLDHFPTTSSAKLDRKAVSALTLPGITPAAEGSDVIDGDDDQSSLTDTEVRLGRIWKQILPAQITGAHPRIMAETDFFHVGGSSLLLLSLQARIKDVFDVDMPLFRMFESSTLGAMAHQIDHGNQQPVEAINWDNETALPPDLLDLPPPAQNTSPKKNNDAKVVLLTGATGRLGRGLLDALLTDADVKHVHCVGVRNVQDRHAMAALGKKITLHEGDLVLPRLGLSENAAARIFGETSVIIHNGADVSYLKTYRSLRAANLQSTKELARLCARYGGGTAVPFHCVSTASVGNVVAAAARGQDDGAGNDFVFRPVSVAAYPPPVAESSSDVAKTAHGYIATKWASEVFLERLKESHPDWEVVVHRPSLISSQGWSRNGPGAELVENLRRYAALMRAVPVVRDGRGGRISGSFNVVSLEEVVRGVMDAVMNTQDEEQMGKVRFLHHIGNLELPLQDLKRWAVEEEVMEGKGGKKEDIQEIDVSEWARKAGELGMHPTMVAMLEEFAAAEGTMTIPRVGS